MALHDALINIGDFDLYFLIYVLHPSGSNFADTLIDASTFCTKIIVVISLLCLYDLAIVQYLTLLHTCFLAGD